MADVVTVPAGETFKHYTEQDGALRDTLIDISADGAEYDIRQHSAHDVENVGVRGSLPARKDSQFHVDIPAGESATIRNVYLGDGGADGQTGIFVSRKHAGRIEIKHATIGNFGDNLIYASSPGNKLIGKNQSDNGTVVLKECFGHNGTSSGFRLGTPSSRAEGCVIDDEYEDNPLADPNPGPGYVSKNWTDRGIWAYSGDPEYVDCRVRVSGANSMVAAVNSKHWNDATGATSSVTLRRLRYTGGGLHEYPGGEIYHDDVREDPDADYSPPDGCPLTPVAAASGSGGTGTPDHIHRLVIDGSEVSGPVEYELTGHASRVDAGSEANVGDGEERIDQRTWQGLVEGGQDDFLVDSEHSPHLTSLELRGPADDIERVVVLVDGTDVSTAETVARVPTDDDPVDEEPADGESGADSGSDSDDGGEYGSPDESRRLYVYGDDWQGSDESSIPYSIVIDGRIEKDEKADEFDRVVDLGDGKQFAAGSVPANSDDAFELRGEVVAVHGDRPRLNWQLNREEWTPPWVTDVPRDDPEPGPTPPPSDPDSVPEEPVDSVQGPDPDLWEQYDHYIEVNADDFSAQPTRYHLVTTGEIVPASTGDRTDNRGWFGHAEGVCQGYHDGIYFDGSLLNTFVAPSIGSWRQVREDPALGVEELPYSVFVDGKAIDHDRFDPRTEDAGTPLDLPVGHRQGGLPSRLTPTKGDATHRINSFHEFDDLDDSDLSPGDVVLFIGQHDWPAVNGTLKRFDTDAITLACHEDATLRVGEQPSSEWGNFGLYLGGKHPSTVNLSFHGASDTVRDHGNKAMGLVFGGRYPVALNTHVSQWGQMGVGDRGQGATIMCIDAHDGLVDASGYGVASGGPVSNKDFETGEYWSESELNTVDPWHERTSLKLFRIDRCRHHIERGTNTAMESGFGVLGPTSVHRGAKDDTHRPGRGEESRYQTVNMAAQNDPVIGGWVRGRPRCFRLDTTWFEGFDSDEYGEAVGLGERYLGDDAPFVQVCGDAEVYDRRRIFRRTQGPFLSGLGEDVSENDPHVWQFGETQVGGARPEFVSNELYEAVTYFRRQ